MTIVILSGVMVHKGRAPSPLPGPTYLTFPQLTTTNQVREHFNSRKFSFLEKSVGSVAWVSFAVKWVTKMSCRAAGS